MTDNFNQTTGFGFPNPVGRPIDNVSTYTMPELERALKGVKSWTQYRDKIINLYGKEVDDVRELFNNW